MTDTLSDQVNETGLGWDRLAAIIALILVILYTTHSFQFLFIDTQATGPAERGTARNHPVYLLFFLVQAGLVLGLLFINIVQTGIHQRLIWAAVFCFLLASSAIWSVSPRETVITSVLFSYQVIAAYVFCLYFSPRQFLQIYFWTAVFIMVTSVLLLVISPDMALTTRIEDSSSTVTEFSGVVGSKNLAGLIYASILILSINGAGLGILWPWRLAIGLMAALSIYLANSLTAVFIVLAMISLAGLCRLGATLQKYLLPSALIALLCLAIALPYLAVELITDEQARQSLFTGRIPLWEKAVEAIRERPLLGYGYGGFFDTNPYSPAWKVWQAFRYFITDSFHNSGLSIMISMGYVGLALYIALVLLAIKSVTHDGISLPIRLNLGLIIGAFLLSSSQELTIIHHNSLASVVILYAAFIATAASGPRLTAD